MFHPDTQFLIDLWTRMAGDEAMPRRSALEPALLGPRVTRTMMIAPGPSAVVRFAGDWIESLHERPLSGAAWRSLWRAEDWERARGAAADAARHGRPQVLDACVGRCATGIEVLLAPLRGPAGAPRLVAHYAPRASLALSAREPRTLRVLGVAAAGPARRGPLSLAAVDGRRVA